MSAAASQAVPVRLTASDPFEVLREITDTHVAVLALIERAFDEAPLPDLDALRARIAAMVDRLRRRVAEKGTASPENLLLPLVCLYDERVMVRAMEPRGEEHWQRLQRRGYAPDEDGGDLFFEKEREVLRRVARLGEGAYTDERQEMTLLVAVYRFCLAEGFQGRCSEAPERLEERIKQLDAALAALVPGSTAMSKPAAASAPPSWFERLLRVLRMQP
ncbi:DotU family type IV/VI secretion system protein [Sorangium sp. So ce295]|uniref:DotU family type IV/VI secretion system protein n=1 Tax=Sorangium sp. So ce295 TaxID=3133295 RepID=UPI003F647B52